MLKNRIFYLLALAGSAVFYLAYNEWSAWLILVFSLILPLISLLLSLRAILTLRIKLTAPERVMRGAEAETSSETYCPTGCPPYKCRIKVTKPITGEKWMLDEGDALPTEYCGALSVSAGGSSVYDYLGIFRFRIRHTPSAIVRVMPKGEKLPIPDEFNRILARAMRPKAGGGFSENHEIRPYRDGDTLNLIHWKLSAKADELMIREPMEPERGLALLTMDINGSPEEVDRKFSRLWCYGSFLLENGIAFEVLALTANGIEGFVIREETDRLSCFDTLLCAPFARTGSVTEHKPSALWHYHIGGEPDEA